MKVTFSIVAHPSRSGMVETLVDEIGDCTVSWCAGDGSLSRHDRVWANARRAWLAGVREAGTGWHVVVQDDAILADGFRDGVRAALGWHGPGDGSVSFYIGSGRPLPGHWKKLTTQAEQEGVSWIVDARLMWGVCVALPVDLIGRMVEHGDRQGGVPDDLRISRYLAAIGMHTWYTFPPLTDHAPVPSLLGHGPGRRALGFTGATPIRWDCGVLYSPSARRPHVARSRARSPRPSQSCDGL